MSSLLLSWHSVTPSNHPKYTVKGTEIENTLCGRWSRYQICAIRALTEDRSLTMHYIVRDAHEVSDEDVRAGKRPPIVARFGEDLDAAIAFCAQEGSHA